jgi:hypothetical protein
MGTRTATTGRCGRSLLYAPSVSCTQGDSRRMSCATVTLGPWNMTWIDGQAAGLFDWDFCHRGPRLEDVAYALEHLAPF